MSEYSGIVLDLPEHEYHARPELSSSQVRQLLKSPADYKWSLTHREAKRAFDLGHAVHTKVLGVGLGIKTYPSEHLTPSGNVSTSKATLEWAAEQREAGFTLVSPNEAEQLERVVAAVAGNPDAVSALEGVAEVSAFAEVEGVACRARFDVLLGSGITDLKSTTRGSSPLEFEREVFNRKYHVQAAWYLDVFRAIRGVDVPFRFVVVDVARPAPEFVGVYTLPDAAIELGREATRYARDLYRRCVESGDWFGYRPATLSVPAWAYFNEEEAEIDVA